MAGRKYDATMNDDEDCNGIQSSVVRSDYTSKSSGQQHQSTANNNNEQDDQDDLHDHDDEDDISLTLGTIIQTNNNEEGDDTLLPNMSSVTLDISCPYFTPRAEALASSINNSAENNCNTIMMGASLLDEPLGDDDEKPLGNNKNNDDEESSEEIMMAVLSTPLNKQTSDTSYREERRMNGLNLR